MQRGGGNTPLAVGCSEMVSAPPLCPRGSAERLPLSKMSRGQPRKVEWVQGGAENLGV